MAILKTDVKLMASERMDDTEYGGGRMTGNEIEDGNVNNMFSDISRLDRVVGRVSMMKGFIGAFTDNQDTYSGAHVILTDPADDPLVSVCMFTTDNPYDTRVGARDRVESYVAQGTRFNGYLWGNHIKGARAIAIIMETSASLPGVGEVIYIAEGEESQYVRTTDVTATPTVFDQGTKNVVTCSISDPLRYGFGGYEPSDPSKVSSSILYNTIVADAANYFGVMRLVDSVEKNDLILNVDSIYTYLVPSAQSETAVVDVTAGSVPNLYSIDDNLSITINANLSTGGGRSLYFPLGAVPGSLSFGANGHYYHSEGSAVIYDNTGESVGVVNHEEGRVLFNVGSATTLNGAAGTITYNPCLASSRIGNSKAMPVVMANRGYNYVTSLVPLPAPGSVIVDYMSQGEWYTLTDSGEGVLEGVAGSGSVNYATGAVIITCGALPDADTAILVNWGSPTEFINRGNKTITSDYAFKHTVTAGSIEPGSLTLTYWIDGQEITATDNSGGDIIDENTVNVGSVLYGVGTIIFNPPKMLDSGSQIEIDSNSMGKTTAVQPLTAGNNYFTLPSFPIKPGSLSMRVDYSGGGYTKSLLIEDNGGGSLVFNDGTINLNRALGHDESDGTTVITPLPTPATINYSTGDIFIHGLSEGLVEWIKITTTTKTL